MEQPDLWAVTLPSGTRHLAQKTRRNWLVWNGSRGVWEEYSQGNELISKPATVASIDTGGKYRGFLDLQPNDDVTATASRILQQIVERLDETHETDEPEKLAAIVEDGDGEVWGRDSDEEWTCLSSVIPCRKWSKLRRPIKVLWEGKNS